MNYQETLTWLFAQLPMFQKVGKVAFKADLSNIIKFCDYLNNPQNTFKSIHVAGTNGKGSTSHMMASVLQEAGYKVGLHTSPHLKHFGERSRINGINMSEEFIIAFVEKHKNFIEQNSFSFFEVSVAMGFQYFAEQKVDIAIIETGLGGRLDSTNIIQPKICVITNIGKDHTAILGNTLEQIAGEKAGIIKPNTAVIIGEYLPETKPVFEAKAKEQNADIYFVEDIFSCSRLHPNTEKTEIEPSQDLSEVKQNRDHSVVEQDHKFSVVDRSGDLSAVERSRDHTEYKTDLKGIYQKKNSKTATLTLQKLNELGEFTISEKNIKNGLLNVVKNTGLRGRWDILQENPLVVADTAHNPAGISQIIQQFKETKHNQLHLVLGFVNDKDVNSILSFFPQNARYYFSEPNVPRKLNIEDLKNIVSNQLNAQYFSTVSGALEKAKENAKKDDFIYIGGSTFVVTEVI